MCEVINILDTILMRAKKMKKRSGVVYALKALVELGRGYHTFREVLAKMVEISGNPKLKYYPIQDAIKYRLACFESEHGEPIGKVRVKICDDVFDLIAERIDGYVKRMEQEIGHNAIG